MEQKKNKIWKARASKAGLLMVGGSYFWSDEDEAYLQELESRAAGTFIGGNGRKLGLTKTQLRDDELGTYRGRKKEYQQRQSDGIPNFQLGETAKSWIRKEWLEHNYGYYEDIFTPQILKGRLCEQDSLALLDEVQPLGEWRKINEGKFEDDFFIGRPDVAPRTRDLIEDVKSSWTIDTFMAVQEPPKIYFGQGQVYMELLDRSEFHLHYCLVSTPEVLLKKLKRSLYYKFKEDASEWRLTGLTEHKEGISPEENPEYIQALEQLASNHSYDDIDESARIKTFEFKRDPEYIAELKIRVEAARYYYDRLTLNGIG